MGGSTPGFNKTGKIWKQRGHLTSHLGQLHRNGLASWNQPRGVQRHVYEDCKVIAYEITEVVMAGIDVHQWIQNIKDRKMNKEREWKERRDQAIEREEIQLLKKLQAKHKIYKE